MLDKVYYSYPCSFNIVSSVPLRTVRHNGSFLLLLHTVLYANGAANCVVKKIQLPNFTVNYIN